MTIKKTHTASCCATDASPMFFLRDTFEDPERTRETKTPRWRGKINLLGSDEDSTRIVSFFSPPIDISISGILTRKERKTNRNRARINR